MESSSVMKEIRISDEAYPPLLREIQNPPRVLYIKGILPDFSLPWISVVGTRKATHEGKELAKNISRSLAEAGAIIVSGLALGIDVSAHEGALAGKGKTIAVLANGLDSIYPRQHENVAKKIITQEGALLSEYEEKTPALPHQFLERNRIISGLSIATIVIEAPLRSGSIATARTAAEQGRDVFVFPGSINHPNYKGSHTLIRNGARLAGSFEDIMEDLKDSFPARTQEMEKKTHNLFSYENEEQRIICETLSSSESPLAVDNIAEATKLEHRIVRQNLTFLILNGQVKERGGLFSLNI